MSIVSAIAMGIAILLSMIYAGIEDHPFAGYGGNYPELGPVKTSIGLPGAPGFVAGTNAVLKYVTANGKNTIFCSSHAFDPLASLSFGLVKFW